ncbi:hypothetical protein DFH07DRAFT_846653 [Mycena maculata]|uniref:Uncharacterized protein n=1 Tax=Mycena maculata TaxID=230809 RepID=A0AAD7I277_9AGAR|nr:hypothetical protein DFH07DRAFT_846653 [Mycena maculata]
MNRLSSRLFAGDLYLHYAWRLCMQLTPTPLPRSPDEMASMLYQYQQAAPRQVKMSTRLRLDVLAHRRWLTAHPHPLQDNAASMAEPTAPATPRPALRAWLAPRAPSPGRQALCVLHVHKHCDPRAHSRHARAADTRVGVDLRVVRAVTPRAGLPAPAPRGAMERDQAPARRVSPRSKPCLRSLRPGLGPGAGGHRFPRARFSFSSPPRLVSVAARNCFQTNVRCSPTAPCAISLSHAHTHAEREEVDHIQWRVGFRGADLDALPRAC